MHSNFSKFLDALQSRNRGSFPIWLMRQAGRYLPEYRALREKHSLRDLFFTPKLAAEITLMPIERFGLDAAILFSDITAIAPAMGFSLDFQEGPKVSLNPTSQKLYTVKEDLSQFEPIQEAIGYIKQKSRLPLIGFCGAPFTIATYFMPNWKEVPQEIFIQFLDQIAHYCIFFLKKQIEAGVDAIQIFDSWANLLENREFEIYSLQYIQKIIQSIDVPSIVFMRGSSKNAEKIAQLNPSAISLDWEIPIHEVRKKVSLPLQGNLDPELLFLRPCEIRKKVRFIFDEMKGDPGLIVNLGHGILPNTPLESVYTLIDEIRKMG